MSRCGFSVTSMRKWSVLPAIATATKVGLVPTPSCSHSAYIRRRDSLSIQDRGETRMTLRKAALAATILSLPLAAQAQPVSGVYVGAGVGANFRLDPDGDYSRSLVSTVRAPTATASGQVKATTEPNFMGLFSVGYGFGNGLRAEVEGNYRTNQVDSATVPGRPRSGSSPW